MNTHFFSRSQLFEPGWLDGPGLGPAKDDGFVECGVLIKDIMLLNKIKAPGKKKFREEP